MKGEKKIMKTLEELVNKLNEVSKAYYSGEEIMFDKEFDELYEELKKLEQSLGILLSRRNW